MNAIDTLLDRPISQSLGWALIHFLWQGALIGVLYFSAGLLLRRVTANVRYAAACSAMLLMFAAPVVTMFARYYSVAQSRREVIAEAARTPERAPTTISPGDGHLALTGPGEIDAAEQNGSLNPGSLKQWATDRLPRFIPWLLALWLLGVMCLSLRLAGGLVMVRRLRRAEKSMALELWEENLTRLSRRLGVWRAVQVCESALVQVPTVIGWLRPLILLPASALTGLSPEQLEALLAHELAHIRRHDYLINLLQTAVETLLFYHPAVWWVSAQVRQEREHCCDDLAVAACGDVLTYARALTALEQMRASQPQLAVAANGGSLLLRIQRLVRGRAPALYGLESWVASFIVVAAVSIVLFGAQSAMLPRDAKAAAYDPTALIHSETATASAGQAANQGSRSRAGQPGNETVLSESAPADDSVQAPGDANGSQSNAQDDKPAESRDFITEMASAGLGKLDVDDLVELKTHGVTPEFVREMSALVSDKLTTDDVVAMKIHGVTPAFANEMKTLGLRLNADELVAFRIHGVTTGFISEMKNAGVGKLDPDSLVAFRIHGVTRAFIQQIKDFGLVNLSVDDLTAFRIHGVTPLFIQTMRTYIHGNLSADDLVGMKIHGVTAEMIKELEIIGFANLSADDLTAFRIHGVNPAFIKSIQEAGYSRMTADELTGLRISGVTPEFIQEVKSRGFANVTLDQLVELRRLNILPSRKKPN